MKRTSILIPILSTFLLTLACAITIPSTTEPPPQPTDTLQPPTHTVAALPPPTDTSIPDIIAPDPLPISHTGIILDDGECYDLDNGHAPHVLDADCDILLVHPQILRPQNGAQLCGHATLTAPSLADCEAAAYDAGDLAPNTDLYICFLSDEGHYGFLVQRHDGAPFETASHRLVFDWWVYP
ncbi:MAG: hypothetical protein PVI78_09765 [Anaerolineales bacterium]